MRSAAAYATMRGVDRLTLPAIAPDHTAIDDVALERVAALGWPGTEQGWLGNWLLRAGGGFTGRANSALPLGDPGLDRASAVDAVVAWYRERGLPPMIQIPLPHAAGLDAWLAARGFAAVSHAHLIVGGVALLADLAAPDRDDLVVQWATDPSERWLSGYRYRGAPLSGWGPTAAADVLRSGDAPRFVSLEAGCDPVAVVRGIVDRGWLGVTALTVHERYRRQGLAMLLMRELGRWALGQGAHSAYLQVANDNPAALAMYARMGMRTHHEYHYRVLDR